MSQRENLGRLIATPKTPTEKVLAAASVDSVRVAMDEAAVHASYLLRGWLRDLRKVDRKQRWRLTETAFAACKFVIEMYLGRAATQIEIRHSGRITYQDMARRYGELERSADRALREAREAGQVIEAELLPPPEPITLEQMQAVAEAVAEAHLELEPDP